MGNREVIIDILAEYAGPMAKFVVQKTLKDLEVSLDDITGNQLDNVLKQIIERCVYDRQKHRQIKRAIFLKLN